MLAFINDGVRVVRSQVSQLMQVRHATKKVVSSKTHMQDSPGKRLGAKKYENSEVKTGQILYRQRGTKWYPGFNVGIGKDHTLFALEPGFVKYYLDPFHPKRKFIGVALNREDKLPYPHFEPTPRRLGRALLPERDASKEAEYLPRKVQLLKPEVEQKLREREEKRNTKLSTFMEKLAEFEALKELSKENLQIAAQRLLKIDGYLRGGKSLKDSRFNATFYFAYDTKLAVKRGELAQDEADAQIDTYKKIALLVDKTVMFDAKYQLVKNLTEEELESLKATSLAELDQLIPDRNKPVSKKDHKQALEIIGRPCFSLKMQSGLEKRYLKPLIPIVGDVNPKDKHVVAIPTMNVETRKIETVYMRKNFV